MADDLTRNTEIHSEADLLPPGGKEGTIPTDLEQATGLERLEILGKMQGIDVFDMRPLDSSRKGEQKIPPPEPQREQDFGHKEGHPQDSMAERCVLKQVPLTTQLLSSPSVTSNTWAALVPQPTHTPSSG